MGYEKRTFDQTYQLDWLAQWAGYSPLCTALKDADSDVEWSYADLFYLSNRLAEKLRSGFGVGAGDRVAVLALNDLETVALFTAAQRIGAILVPINYRLAAREVEYIVSDAEPSLLVVQEQFAGLLTNSVGKFAQWAYEGKDSLKSYCRTELARFAETRGAETLRLVERSWEVPFSGTPESAAMILYTSGTTGRPKGALISNSMLHWNSINTTLRLNLSQSDVTVSFAPFFHTGGWNVLLTPFLHRGAKTVLMKKFEPESFLSLIEREGATIFFGVPTTLDMMHRSPHFAEADLSRVRYAIVGGEPMPIDLIRAWQHKGIPIRQGFGLTEFGPNCFSLNEEDSLRKIGSIGFPNFYIETKVVDERGRAVERGEIGELLLRGPVCSPGYWKNAKATSETIVDSWLHTGDLVRQDEEGYFYVSGRKKDMFISGGENVYPVEIEQVISGLPAVREVAVVGVADPRWGEVGRAFVALKSGQVISADELRAHCERNLAKFKVPKSFEIVPELPKGDSGKILKRALREPVSN
jgi:fatty-acyl-CoA synthase